MSKDSIESLADSWLIRWSKWARNGSGQGYPKRWVTERVKEGGIMAGSPRPPTEMPEDIAIVDRAVAKLGNRHRSMLANAINLQYLVIDKPKEWKAERCKTTIKGFDALVGRAQRQVYFQVQTVDSPCIRLELGVSF